MQKTSGKNACPPETEPSENPARKFSTTAAVRNQDQIPFLYMAVREPPADYKNVPETGKKLYRIVKLK